MKSEYDVIVVGGGPAGSIAAKLAAEGGVSVCVLEKDRDIGYPVRCGEAVGDSGIRKFVEPKANWIAATISGFSMTSPDKTRIEGEFSNDTGYILHRRIFDYDLAILAAQKGAEIITRAYVDGLIIEDNVVKGVTLKHIGKRKEIRAKIVIGADGIESRIGRWAGIRTQLKMKDMESGFQYTLSNIGVDQDRIDFFIGSNYAPGGYLWIFPKGDNTANVGLATSGTHSKNKSAQNLLNEFVEKEFPNASKLTMVCGGIPCASPIKKPVANGVMLVGDAAHHVNPVTGGGITSGMTGGWIAGQVAADSIRKNDTSEKQLTAYPEWVHKEFGKKYERVYKIKEAISKLTDSDINDIAIKVKKIPREKRSLAKIFSISLFKKPMLIIDALKVFAGF